VAEKEVQDRSYDEMMWLSAHLRGTIKQMPLFNRKSSLPDIEELVVRLCELVEKVDLCVRAGIPPTAWSNEATQGNCTE
jgi:hypothetical protein